MSAPWEILGLTPSCTEKELREAYARLLKLHRPDRDPEGFRRVRDAYEFMRHVCARNANAEAGQSSQTTPKVSQEETQPVSAPVEFRSDANANADGDPDDADDVSTLDGPAPAFGTAETDQVINPGAPPENVRPKRTLQQRVARRLKKAFLAGDETDKRRIIRKLVKFWRANATETGWDQLVVDQLERNPDAILPHLGPSDAVLDTSRESMQVASALLLTRARRGEWPDVTKILDALMQRLKEHPGPAVSGTLLLGARLIGLLYWKKGQEIANAVYPHLSERDRQFGFGQLDMLLQAGKEIVLLNERDRSLFARTLAGAPVNPDDPATQMAIRNVSTMAAPTAKTCLRDYFPTFAAKLKVHKNSPARRPVGAGASSSKSGGGFGIIAMAVILTLRLIGGCASHEASSSVKTLPTFTKSDYEEWRKAAARQQYHTPETPDDVVKILNQGNRNPADPNALPKVESQSPDPNAAKVRSSPPELGPAPPPREESSPDQQAR